jgi:hypothetical protein
MRTRTLITLLLQACGTADHSHIPSSGQRTVTQLATGRGSRSSSAYSSSPPGGTHELPLR